MGHAPVVHAPVVHTPTYATSGYHASPVNPAYSPKKYGYTVVATEEPEMLPVEEEARAAKAVEIEEEVFEEPAPAKAEDPIVEAAEAPVEEVKEKVEEPAEEAADCISRCSIPVSLLLSWCSVKAESYLYKRARLWLAAPSSSPHPASLPKRCQLRPLLKSLSQLWPCLAPNSASASFSNIKWPYL